MSLIASSLRVVLTLHRTNMTEETRAFQYLSFYQKDLALALYKNYDTPASSFCPDVDISPLFKVEGRSAVS